MLQPHGLLKAMRRGEPAWARSALTAVLGAGLILGGCSGNDVAVTVDLLSFVPAEDRTGTYDAPSGVRLPPTTIEPQLVTLGEALAERVEMERVQLNFVIEFDGDAGSGSGTADVALYLVEPDSTSLTAALYENAPVYTGRADIVGGATRALSGMLEATAENGLLPLFQGGDVVLGIAITFDATNSQVPITGEWTIRQIDALVLGHTDPI